jgi:hypothetical protein
MKRFSIFDFRFSIENLHLPIGTALMRELEFSLIENRFACIKGESLEEDVLPIENRKSEIENPWPVDTGRASPTGTYSDPIVLPGTGIGGLTVAVDALKARVHRQAKRQQNNCELWYRDIGNGNWYLFPVQPILKKGLEPTITRRYRQPGTLECRLADPNGLLTPENLESAYNVNQAGQADPLMDEARPILLRAAVLCYSNLAAGIAPTSTLAPSAGTLASLTDGVLGDIAAASADYVAFAPGDATSFDIVVDLGAIQALGHAVLRFATKSGTCSLPASVQIAASENGSLWTSLPARPVGGEGGDWDEDLAGRTLDVACCDLESRARYVRFRITPVGAQTLFMDELAVYGGDTANWIGKNVFCGYLGDDSEFGPDGIVSFRATDVLKKLGDNNEARLTAMFGGTGPVDIADILATLLTSSAYWKGTGTAYDAPFTAGEIGWAIGSSLTGFKMPVWQGQGNNMLGYAYELIHQIGWSLYADGNGVLQLMEPPYKQQLADRVLIAYDDGNHDTRHNVRYRAGKEMRNVVEVSTGRSSAGQATSIQFEPSSVSRFGRRRVIITDPLAVTRDLRVKIGRYVLRDYAWRLQTLENEIVPDFDTGLKRLYGFRAPARPNLYSKASETVGRRRKRELWSLESLTEHISVGDWRAEADYVSYVPLGPDPPDGLTLTPGTGGQITQMVLAWNAITDPAVTKVRVYLSRTSETAGFAPNAQFSIHLGTSYAISPVTVGQQYWVYMTTLDMTGNESMPSVVVSAIAGGAAGTDSDWTVTDLAASFNQVSPPDNANGYYTYEFLITWTSPPAGFKHMELYFNVDGIPANPQLREGWTYQDEWHGPYIPPGKQWDRQTDGLLTWYGRFRTATPIASGTHVYWRMWTCHTTNGWHGDYISSIAYATIP